MSDDKKIENALYQIYRRKCYDEVIKVINKLDVPYTVIKGEALSYQIYGSTDKRRSSDIDILVSRDDLRSVEKLLAEEGFVSKQLSRSDRITMLSGSHQVAPWLKDISPWGSVNIDLNFEIFWGEFDGKRTDIKEFFSDACDVDIYGYTVKTLPIPKAMVQLILHHYKEMNSIYHIASHNSINYDMFKDMYYLWKNNSEHFTKDKLAVICSEYEIAPYAYYVLYYTNCIFNDKDLNEVVETIETPEGIALLDCYGLDVKERKVWRVDFKIRYESEDLFKFIKDDLTNVDKEKLERNRRIFE